MFLTLTQVMLFVLLMYVLWSALFKPAAAPKPPKPTEGPKILIDENGIEIKAGKGGRGGGSGSGDGGDGGAKKPREYLAWLGGFILFLSVLLAFFSPNNPAIAEVWSILSLPLKPLGLAILLLLFAVGGGIKKGGITKDAHNQVKIAFTILLVFSIPLVAYSLVQLTETNALAALQASAQRREKAEAIVLLGQATTQLTLLEVNQIHLTDAGDRIIQTAREYQRQLDLGIVPQVIVSAGARPGLKAGDDKANVIEAKDIARILISLGVTPEDIQIEPTGVDIRTSAVAVRQLLDWKHIPKRIILVSSALNMQRATQTFAKEGIKVIPSPASFYTFGAGAIPKVIVRTSEKNACNTLSISVRNTRDIQFSDFMPSVEALLLSTRVINEFWSSVYYFLRGWLATGADTVSPARDVGC